MKQLPQIRIKVGKIHITTAKERDSHRCMIVDAIKEAVPEARYIMVDLQSIRFSVLGHRYTYFTPSMAQLGLLRFDRGDKSITPFNFSLRKGIMRKVGWQANHPNISRKGKKYKMSGKKRAVRVTKEREFGIRKLTAA